MPILETAQLIRSSKQACNYITGDFPAGQTKEDNFISETKKIFSLCYFCAHSVKAFCSGDPEPSLVGSFPTDELLCAQINLKKLLCLSLFFKHYYIGNLVYYLHIHRIMIDHVNILNSLHFSIGSSPCYFNLLLQSKLFYAFTYFGDCFWGLFCNCVLVHSHQTLLSASSKYSTYVSPYFHIGLNNQ